MPEPPTKQGLYRMAPERAVPLKMYVVYLFR